MCYCSGAEQAILYSKLFISPPPLSNSMKHIHHPHRALKLNLAFISAVLNASFIQADAFAEPGLFFCPQHSDTQKQVP